MLGGGGGIKNNYIGEECKLGGIIEAATTAGLRGIATDDDSDPTLWGAGLEATLGIVEEMSLTED